MIKRKYRKLKHTYDLGKRIINDPYHIDGARKSILETKKRPFRHDIINYLIESLKRDINYLEIGVRYPEENFDKIKAKHKFSVDPGLENKENPVDFKVTSDTFFSQLSNGEILNKAIKFDVIFIDGLHIAEQAMRDIDNALEFLTDDGFIVMHDCNPPTEFHASESYYYRLSPSSLYWNGTTWKAFFKARLNKDLSSCCIDTDWGIGIISKTVNLGSPPKIANPFYEYKVLEEHRKDSLNLISFNELKELIKV